MAEFNLQESVQELRDILNPSTEGIGGTGVFATELGKWDLDEVKDFGSRHTPQQVEQVRNEYRTRYGDDPINIIQSRRRADGRIARTADWITRNIGSLIGADRDTIDRVVSVNTHEDRIDALRALGYQVDVTPSGITALPMESAAMNDSRPAREVGESREMSDNTKQLNEAIGQITERNGRAMERANEQMSAQIQQIEAQFPRKDRENNPERQAEYQAAIESVRDQFGNLFQGALAQVEAQAVADGEPASELLQVEVATRAPFVQQEIEEQVMVDRARRTLEAPELREQMGVTPADVKMARIQRDAETISNIYAGRFNQAPTRTPSQQMAEDLTAPTRAGRVAESQRTNVFDDVREDFNLRETARFMDESGNIQPAVEAFEDVSGATVTRFADGSVTRRTADGGVDVIPQGQTMEQALGTLEIERPDGSVMSGPSGAFVDPSTMQTPAWVNRGQTATPQSSPQASPQVTPQPSTVAPPAPISPTRQQSNGPVMFQRMDGTMAPIPDTAPATAAPLPVSPPQPADIPTPPPAPVAPPSVASQRDAAPPAPSAPTVRAGQSGASVEGWLQSQGITNPTTDDYRRAIQFMQTGVDPIAAPPPSVAPQQTQPTQQAIPQMGIPQPSFLAPQQPDRIGMQPVGMADEMERGYAQGTPNWLRNQRDQLGGRFV